MKYINKTIEYGLYLLVFLLPIQTRWIIKAGELNNGYWEYGTLSLYGTDILLMAILVMFLFYRFKTKKLEIRNWKSGNKENKSQITNYQLPITKIWWLIAGLELMVFISIFVAADKTVAIYGYLRFLLGVGLFWLVISASFNKIKLIYSFLAGIALQALLGIYQFFSQSGFAAKWLGLAAHNPADLGVSVVETLDGTRWLRAYGGLDHPNVLGGLLVVGILLVIAAVIKMKKANKFSIFNFQFSIFKQFSIFNAIIVILVIGLFITFSRGAWLGLVVGLLAFLIINIYKKKLKAQKITLQIILILSITVFILSNIYSDLVLTRFSDNARLEIKSNTERIESLETARDLIKSNFFFGVGIGNYTNTVEQEIISGQPAWFYQPVHNFFLLVFSEIGVFGLIFMLWLISYMLVKSFKKVEYINLALILAILIMMLVDHWYWSLHFGVLFFWLISGLIIKQYFGCLTK
ncbi:hypothetical protein DRH27_01835 [Candidatus Falkowbacteria bacterium]|nr:MAG: hypothetical protein DRH27_01835 [Candidatus Falkowbacteria bacterium]